MNRLFLPIRSSNTTSLVDTACGLLESPRSRRFQELGRESRDPNLYSYPYGCQRAEPTTHQVDVLRSASCSAPLLLQFRLYPGGWRTPPREPSLLLFSR